MHVRLLLLGGTGEARALACALDEMPVEVISSLAGRVSNPALPVGAVRIGGFGGVDGLGASLRAEAIAAVIDATHPFAATMTAHAAAACARAAVPLLVLQRPAWTSDPTWARVPDIAAAAEVVRASASTVVFLTTGKRDVAAFADDPGRHYLVRVVDPPETAAPPRHTLVLDRGPYSLDGELSLMREHAVDLLVTKDSGGTMTAAKLAAARDLGVPVIVVDRPPLPTAVEIVDTVDAALTWLSSRS